MKHRIVFTGVWILFAAALIVFPGFEVHGFAAGMIIGGWPAMISARIWTSQYHHPFILLLMMLILSGTTVGLLAWLLDKARMPKTIWIVLGVSIVLGASVLGSQGLNYEQWQGTLSVSQAMESANYQPSRWDFNRELVIPRSLAGGLWGLYGIEAVCVLCSVAILLMRVTTRTQPDKPVNEEPHQRRPW
ncbi:MAG: hypothetical protein HYV36_05190 [Lentisphaerae bacterium]|nr:hypothetical protein [Lentisphaerota bacterium]